MRIALVGFGRMGREVESAAVQRGHTVVAVVDPAAPGRRIRRRLDTAKLQAPDVALEFTAPSEAEDNVLALLGAGISVVCGTTGWDATGAAVRGAVRKSRRGFLFAPNFSVGMNLFYAVIRDAARRFACTGLYDPFVLEVHHRGKRDAPSGTALRLAAIVAEADPRRCDVQIGLPNQRIPPGAVHVASVRAGHEPGVHTVGFGGEHDEVTLTHRARGRGGLALGAVLAAEWIRGRRGVFSFDRVLADLLGKGVSD